jgi:hypothetical protein
MLDARGRASAAAELSDLGKLTRDIPPCPEILANHVPVKCVLPYRTPVPIIPKGFIGRKDAHL